MHIRWEGPAMEVDFDMVGSSVRGERETWFLPFFMFKFYTTVSSLSHCIQIFIKSVSLLAPLLVG